MLKPTAKPVLKLPVKLQLCQQGALRVFSHWRPLLWRLLPQSLLWRLYYRKARLFIPRGTLLKAMGLFPQPGRAVDLGCGQGLDTLALLAAGWHVTAIDNQPQGLAKIREFVASAGVSKRLLTLVCAAMEEIAAEEVELPPCQLFNSSFTLPFCQPEAFPALWRRIVASLDEGGVFAGQFFGPADSFCQEGLALSHTEADVKALLVDFDIVSWKEVNEPGQDAMSLPKHWHVFHVVARRRA